MKIIPIKIQSECNEEQSINSFEFEHLEKKDEQFLHLNKLIETKKKMLLEKQNKLKIVINQNIFLEKLKDDYLKYYNYIIQQKRDQIKALELLNTYINQLSISGNLSKQNLEDSKEEQKKIIDELKKIKTNLDLIIKDTDRISNKF